MSVAAVIVARGKHKKELEKTNMQAVDDALEAAKVFDELDSEKKGALDRDQTRDLLTRVTGVEVNDDGLQMVLNDCKKNMGDTLRELQTDPGVAFGGDDSVALPKDHLVKAVSKFRYYLKNKVKIDKIYDQFDTNKSGSLDRGQLKKFIQSEEDKFKKREAFGVLLHLRVSDDDVNYILSDCDMNENGAIDKAEVLSALAKWEELAKAHVEEKKKSCACLLS